jgi:hypothetical protein
MSSPVLWRSLLALSGVIIFVVGPFHPRGDTMADMLGHPDWLWMHASLLFGFILLLIGLIVLQRSTAHPARTATWLKLAIAATALQSIEMVMHTVAYLDHAHLVAGESTPILTTHLRMSIVLYPVFGAAMIGLIIAGVRDRTLGSPWIAWLGILGAAAHGLAAPLVVGLEIPGADALFPLLTALALWAVLAAVWPVRTPIA